MTFERTRAWERTGLYHPAPFGLSLPNVWLDAELIFYTSALVDNGFGGFEDQSATTTWLMTRGHAELTDQVLPTAPGLGTIMRRFYEIIIPMPADPDTIPVKGQRVTFTDMAGRAIDVAVQWVEIPEGSADHVEIQSEEFE